MKRTIPIGTALCVAVALASPACMMDTSVSEQSDDSPYSDEESIETQSQALAVGPATTIKSQYNGRCLDLDMPSGNTANLGNGNKVQLWDCHGGANQQFQFHDDGTIRNPASGRCLDVSGYGTSNGSIVHLWDCHLGPNQIWERMSDGSIRNPVSNRVLDVDFGTIANNGSKVQLWDRGNSSGNQQWVTDKTVSVYLPPKSLGANLADDERVFEPCLASATGNVGMGDATGAKLTAFKQCLAARGYEFLVSPDPRVPGAVKQPWANWVADVTTYCKEKDVLPGQGIGNNYNHYKACLRARGVEPSVSTVGADYISDVNLFCWGHDVQGEEALSWMLIVATTLIQAPTPSFSVSALASALSFGIETADLAMDLSDRMGANDGRLRLFKLDPRALSDYPGYERCLNERSVPGLNFKPAHTQSTEQLGGWANQVSQYCYSKIISTHGNTSWSANTMRDCLATRKYPTSDVPYAWKLGGILGLEEEIYDTAFKVCTYPPRKGRTEAPLEYVACLNNIGVPLSADDRKLLGDSIRSACKAKYSGNMGANATAYRACVKNSDTWTDNDEYVLSLDVQSYCNATVIGGGVESYNEYWGCLRERGVTFEVTDGWKSEVKAYCLRSQAGGGGFANYDGYKACLQLRRVSFDASEQYWIDGVRAYCAKSNAGISLDGNKTCLNQRGVSYSSDAWCPDVRDYCARQSYPNAWLGYTEARCRSERGC